MWTLEKAVKFQGILFDAFSVIQVILIVLSLYVGQYRQALLALCFLISFRVSKTLFINQKWKNQKSDQDT